MQTGAGVRADPKEKQTSLSVTFSLGSREKTDRVPSPSRDRY